MRRKVTRRTFLRGTGVALGLPWVEGLAPRVRASTPKLPRRFVGICTPLGLHAPHFFPIKAGRDYGSTAYLDLFKDLRNDYTVISGLAHPDVGASHDSIFSFLTTAPHPERRAGFRNTISLDQFAAEHIGGETRFPSLPLSCEGFSLSWTRSGALVPSEMFPSSLFAKLFLDGRPEDVAAQARRLLDGQSILDAVRSQAKQLQPALSQTDRDKMDEYFTSVRELEQRLAKAEEWARKPKPKVDAKPPQNNMNAADVVGKAQLMYDLIHLAIQTDSCRLFTLLLLGTSAVPPIAGVNLGHHDLSHHGQDAAKLAQLKTVETEKLKTLQAFLIKLKDTKEAGTTLLDQTCVFFSSNLGNASTHATKNLPVLVAGGGFKHGQHLAFDVTNAPPLANLYVSLLQQLGINASKFGSSTGTLTGLV